MGDTLGALTNKAVLVDPSVSCRKVNSLFRADPGLRSVVVNSDLTGAPTLVNRGAFYQVMAGPRGYGWALYAHKRVAEILPSIAEPLTLPADTTIEDAGLAVLRRDDLAAGDDLLVLADDGTAAPIAVSSLLAALARSYQQRVAEISRAEHRFRSLLHAASGTVMVLDALGRITYTSPHVAEWVGLEDEKVLVGRMAQDLVHPDDREYSQEVVRALNAEPGSELRLVFRVQRADGDVRWMEGAGRNLMHDEAVGGLVLNFRDVTERRVVEEELRHHAFRDSLTGLPNRVVLSSHVERMLAEARRHDETCAAFLIDLDRFKDVNDLYGHAAGDALLEQVAERLLAAVGSAGVVGRLGGDEFLALSRGAALARGPEPLADQILAALRDPFVVGGRHLAISASVGIVHGIREDPVSLLRDADIALYEAKGSGRDRHRTFTPAMKEQLEKRAWTEANLVGVMERDELVLHFQPGIRLSDMNLTHVETLIRWQHPERGLIPPAEFIPTLESTGQIVSVGRWVLEMSCRAVAGMHRRGHTLRASVNVSPRQFEQGSTLERDVAAALEKSGLPPEYLCLEITENALLGDAAMIHNQLHALKSLGVGIAIDDFGVGYSSLSYLATLPIDVVKIDRSFVSELGRSREAEVVLQAVLNLGEALSLSTVAEGVEEEVQLDYLRDRGCGYGQGFLFSKPKPFEEFLCFLDQWGPTGDYRPLSLPAAAARR